MKTKKGVLSTILPVVIWMVLFFVIPLFLVIIVSFFTRGEYGNIVYKFTLSNYTRLFNVLYLKILVDSLVVSFVTTLICLCLGYPFAYFLAKAPKKYKAILMMLVILPFWTNSLVRTYAWIILLRTDGVINTYLMKFGFIKHPISMLYNNAAVLIGMVYMMFPFMVLPLYASIEKIDNSYIQAAYDLGASPFKAFKKIMLPLTVPGIVAGCLLVFVPTLGYFFIPDLLGGSKTLLISNLIKNQFLTARDWPFGSSVSVVLILIMFVLIGIYMKFGKQRDKTGVI